MKVTIMAKRKRYTEEFKREAVRLLLSRGEQSATSVAESLGVGQGQLYEWRKRYADIEESAVNGRGETEKEELARLRREVAGLRKEKEVLRKSIVFFVKENDR